MKNDREKTLAKDILDKEIIQNIQENQKTNNSTRKLDLDRHGDKEETYCPHPTATCVCDVSGGGNTRNR